MRTVMLKTKEVSTILGISLRQAYEIMNVFDGAGITVTIGNTKMISVRNLAKWLCRQDGTNLEVMMQDIITATKNA